MCGMIFWRLFFPLFFSFFSSNAFEGRRNFESGVFKRPKQSCCEELLLLLLLIEKKK